MGFYAYNRSQLSLFRHSMDERLPEGDKCRFVVHLVSRLDLERLQSRYSPQGNDAFPPEIMLATWFYAYSMGIASSRKLEELCRYDVRFIYVSADLKPDHTTLNRFRKHHLDLLADYFLQLLRMAREDGISTFDVIAIDGTKIQAACSKKQSRSARQLQRELDRVRDSIRTFLEFGEDDDDAPPNEGLQRLKQRQRQLEALSKTLDDNASELKAEYRRGHKINRVDPDARRMAILDAPGYNGQVAVESTTHLIVANTVVRDSNDQHQFKVMHKACESTLGPSPDRQYTSDAGFFNLDQLEYVEENEVDAIIVDPAPHNRSIQQQPTPPEEILAEERPLTRSDFVFEALEDRYICPDQRPLPFLRTKGPERLYQSLCCDGCRLIHLCLAKSNRSGKRQIIRHRKEYLAEEMARRLQTPHARVRRLQRATSVEPVIGNLKANLGFRRFRLHGLHQVKGEFNLICFAHNINVLFKHWKPQRAVVAARKAVDSAQIALRNGLIYALSGLLKANRTISVFFQRVFDGRAFLRLDHEIA